MSDTVPDIAGRDLHPRGRDSHPVFGPDALAHQKDLMRRRDERVRESHRVHDSDGLNGAHPTRLSTVSMHWVDPFDVQLDQITIHDIAHSLSRTCRYNGHVPGFLSVARHSLWVSSHALLDTPLLKLQGLLHDAAEAYVGDMIRPLKHRPEMSGGYLEAEAIVERAISEVFGLPFPLDPRVGEADRLVLVDLELPNKRWTQDTSPDEDKAEFLARYDLLVGEVHCDLEGLEMDEVTLVLPASPDGAVKVVVTPKEA